MEKCKSSNPIVIAAFDAMLRSKKEYEKSRAIYERILELEKSTPAMDAGPNANAASEIDINKLTLSDSRAQFADDVREVVKLFKYQEFMVAHVEAALSEIGKPVTGKSPRSRISTVLRKLEEQRYIEVTQKGGGNVPHKYRNSPNQKASSDDEDRDRDAEYDELRMQQSLQDQEGGHFDLQH